MLLLGGAWQQGRALPPPWGWGQGGILGGSGSGSVHAVPSCRQITQGSRGICTHGWCRGAMGRFGVPVPSTGGAVGAPPLSRHRWCSRGPDASTDGARGRGEPSGAALCSERGCSGGPCSSPEPPLSHLAPIIGRVPQPRLTRSFTGVARITIHTPRKVGKMISWLSINPHTASAGPGGGDAAGAADV